MHMSFQGMAQRETIARRARYARKASKRKGIPPMSKVIANCSQGYGIGNYRTEALTKLAPFVNRASDDGTVTIDFVRCDEFESVSLRGVKAEEIHDVETLKVPIVEIKKVAEAVTQAEIAAETAFEKSTELED